MEYSIATYFLYFIIIASYTNISNAIEALKLFRVSML